MKRWKQVQIVVFGILSICSASAKSMPLRSCSEIFFSREVWLENAITQADLIIKEHGEPGVTLELNYRSAVETIVLEGVQKAHKGSGEAGLLEIFAEPLVFQRIGENRPYLETTSGQHIIIRIVYKGSKDPLEWFSETGIEGNIGELPAPGRLSWRLASAVPEVAQPIGLPPEIVATFVLKGP